MRAWGGHTITYSYTNGNVCTNTCTFTITVYALPTVNCPGNSSVCINAPAFALTGGSPGGGIYSGPGVSAGMFDPADAGVGMHTITYAYTNGIGCTNSCTFSITVNALPTVNCPGNSSVCVNAPAFALTGGSPGGGTYSGPGVSAGMFDPADAGVGAHTITYSYTNGNGCSNSCTFSITVNALPTVNCPGNSSVCVNAPAFALTGGSPGGGTYGGPGVSAGMFNPATAGTGTHTISYSYIDGNGCANSCTFTITVSPDDDNDGICNNEDNCLNTANSIQTDSDCDGVGDVCDVCPGGNDAVDNNNDGLPDCKYPPAYAKIIAAWKCGKNKVLICHNGDNTNCINYNALAAHIAHGDFLGPCDNASCNEGRSDGETSVVRAAETSGVSLFPNPAASEAWLDLSACEGSAFVVRLLDVRGVLIKEIIVAEASHEPLRLDLNGLGEGLYFVRLQPQAEAVQLLKLVVEQN